MGENQSGLKSTFPSHGGRNEGCEPEMSEKKGKKCKRKIKSQCKLNVREKKCHEIKIVKFKNIIFIANHSKRIFNLRINTKYSN